MSLTRFAKVRLGVVAGAVVAAGMLVGVLWSVTLDGSAQESWRMAGRLHPLLVHFPVALLLIAPLVDVVGCRRPAWREPAGFLVGLGAFAACAAAMAGLALAQADGHSGPGLSRHLWGGAAVAVSAMATNVFRVFRHWRAYAILSSSTVGLLGWTAHQGGNLTHGDDYLTQGLPAGVRSLFGLAPGPDGRVEDPNTVYGAAISGILEAHCLSCHGPQKQKGSYRVDIFEAMVGHGQSGLPAIAPGDASKSELVRRMRLPLTDRKVMPPRGRPRPTRSELQVLHWWISNDASRSLTLSEARQREPAVMDVLGKLMQETGRELYVPRVPDHAHLTGAVAALAASLDVSLTAVSKRPGDGLILQCRNREKSVSNETLVALAPIAALIVEADLGGTSIDDHGIAALARFDHLTKLHLERTQVTGTTLSQLAELPELMLISLCDSRLSDAGLQQAATIRALRKIATTGSAATREGLHEYSRARPDCETL